jgi:hypothetical protein
MKLPMTVLLPLVLVGCSGSAPAPVQPTDAPSTKPDDGQLPGSGGFGPGASGPTGSGASGSSGSGASGSSGSGNSGSSGSGSGGGGLPYGTCNSVGAFGLGSDLFNDADTGLLNTSGTITLWVDVNSDKLPGGYMSSHGFSWSWTKSTQQLLGIAPGQTAVVQANTLIPNVQAMLTELAAFLAAVPELSIYAAGAADCQKFANDSWYPAGSTYTEVSQ